MHDDCYERYERYEHWLSDRASALHPQLMRWAGFVPGLRIRQQALLFSAQVLFGPPLPVLMVRQAVGEIVPSSRGLEQLRRGKGHGTRHRQLCGVPAETRRPPAHRIGSSAVRILDKGLKVQVLGQPSAASCLRNTVPPRERRTPIRQGSFPSLRSGSGFRQRAPTPSLRLIAHARSTPQLTQTNSNRSTSR